MAEEKLIERLRKMLALAASNPNENEARTAAELAHALMIEHNLSHEDLGESPVTLAGYHQADLDIQLGRKLPRECNYVAAVLNKHFMVKIFIQRNQLHREGRRTLTEQIVLQIYGKRHNAQIAHHFYIYLAAVYKDLFKAMVDRAMASDGQSYSKASQQDRKRYEIYRDSYYQGLTLGLDHILEAQSRKAAKEHGLVPVDPLLNQLYDEAEADEYKPRKKQVDHSALTLGFGDARKVELSKPLAEQPPASERELEEQRLNKLLYLRGDR